MRKLTLGTRLTLGGILVVLVPLVIIGVLAVFKASDALTELSREQAGMVAAKLADMTQVAMSEQLRTSKSLALDHTVLDTVVKVGKGKSEESATDIEGLNKHLQNAMKQIGSEYETIIVTNSEGSIFADGSNGEYKGLNIAERDYFKTAKAGKANIGSVIKSKKPAHSRLRSGK